MDDDTRPNTYDPYTPGAAYGPAVAGGPDDRLGWRGRAATWWVRRRSQRPVLAAAVGGLLVGGLLTGLVVGSAVAGPEASPQQAAAAAGPREPGPAGPGPGMCPPPPPSGRPGRGPAPRRGRTRSASGRGGAGPAAAGWCCTRTGPRAGSGGRTGARDVAAAVVQT